MKIIPIHKSVSRSSMNSYRDIAIPPTLAKIQEKLMTKRPNKIIMKKAISIRQYEFVKKRSISTNILELMHFGCDAFAKGEQVDVSFADFSKAFDKVQHSKSIEKLA